VHDELLKPYLDAASEKEAERILEQLTKTYLRPLVRRINPDEDIQQTVLFAVVKNIKENRKDKLSRPIRALKAYVATSVRHAAINQSKMHQKEGSHLSLEVKAEEQGWEPIAPPNDPAILMDSHEILQQIWSEIKAQAPKEVAVLLLDFQESDLSPVDLFPVQNIASLEEMAACMNMECQRINDILMSLPWEDNQIAAELGLGLFTVRNYRTKVRSHLRETLSGLLHPGKPS